MRKITEDAVRMSMLEAGWTTPPAPDLIKGLVRQLNYRLTPDSEAKRLVKCAVQNLQLADNLGDVRDAEKIYLYPALEKLGFNTAELREEEPS